MHLIKNVCISIEILCFDKGYCNHFIIYSSLVFVTTGAYFTNKKSLVRAFHKICYKYYKYTYRATAAAELLCLGKYSAFSSSVILSRR